MIHDVARAAGEVAYARLTAAAQDKLRLCLLAYVSVALAGASAVRLRVPAAGSAHRLFSGARAAEARSAAGFNAAAMHARTQDDFHPIGNLHIATVALPALLAAAEVQPGPGERLLDALAAGYAVATGLSKRFSPITTPRGLRSTCLYAPFGATAAVARQWRFSVEETANALALTASLVGGTTQCWLDGSDEYQLHVAQGAAHALLACELTLAGVRGGAGALDGKAGLYASLTGEQPRFADIAADFNADAALLDTVLKRYPVSGICQPVVLACEKLAPRLAGRRIERVKMVMRAFELSYPGTDNRGPFRSFSDRLMSARWCVASVLTAGRFDFETFVQPASDAVEQLVARIELSGDTALPPLSCRVRVHCADGAVIEHDAIDAGQQLAINADSLRDWAVPLWQVSRRDPAAFDRAAAAVAGGAAAPVAEMLAACLPG